MEGTLNTDAGDHTYQSSVCLPVALSVYAMEIKLAFSDSERHPPKNPKSSKTEVPLNW